MEIRFQRLLLKLEGFGWIAGSKSDSLAYGWLFQWGRPADGHESRTSPVTGLNQLSNDLVPGHGDFIIGNALPLDWLSTQNNDLWEGGSGVNNPCPPGFRIPTKEDWMTEKATWSSPDADGAYKSPLRLTLAGFRELTNGMLYNEGVYGFYWSSSDIGGRVALVFLSYNIILMQDEGSRGDGFTVRCIKN